MSSNKLATIMDIANMFWSIKLDKNSRRYTNFYYNRRIYRHARLGQGLKISPYIAVQALRYTLSPTVLQSFLSSINCNNFPYQSYDDCTEKISITSHNYGQFRRLSMDSD